MNPTMKIKFSVVATPYPSKFPPMEGFFYQGVAIHFLHPITAVSI